MAETVTLVRCPRCRDRSESGAALDITKRRCASRPFSSLYRLFNSSWVAVEHNLHSWKRRVVIKLFSFGLVVGAVVGAVATLLLFEREVSTITLTTPSGEYSILLSSGRINQHELLDAISESEPGRMAMTDWVTDNYRQPPSAADALANISNAEQWLPPGESLDDEAVTRLKELVEQLHQPLQLQPR